MNSVPALLYHLGLYVRRIVHVAGNRHFLPPNTRKSLNSSRSSIEMCDSCRMLELTPYRHFQSKFPFFVAIATKLATTHKSGSRGCKAIPDTFLGGFTKSEESLSDFFSLIWSGPSCLLGRGDRMSSCWARKKV